MVKIKYEHKNEIKPWMVLGNNDWVYLLGTIISILILLFGTIRSFICHKWFSFIYLAIGLLWFIWIVPKFLKVRKTIITKFGSDNWTEEIVFNDYEIIVTEMGSKGVFTTKRQYNEVISYREEKDTIVLKMKELPHIVFPKDAFVIGDLEECKKLIEDKKDGIIG